MRDTMPRVFGWRFLLVTGDPCVLDRWLWLRGRLRRGRMRTFDAGCGNGGFSFFAASVGNEVVAASFSPDEQERARRRADALGVTGVDFRVIDLRELEDHRAALGMFDQIICLETIEHVTDDEGLVTSLAAMLKPGGQLLLSTPYDRHLPLHTEDPEPSPEEDGSHVRYGYSQEHLSQIVARAGLEAQDESFLSGVVSQKLTDLMRRLTARIGLSPAWVIMLPLRALAIFDKPLTALLGYPDLSVALRAVKRPSQDIA
jgi:SAM-dependent methyltransferase